MGVMSNLYLLQVSTHKIGCAPDEFVGLFQEHITSQASKHGITSTPSKVFNVTTTDTRQN